MYTILTILFVLLLLMILFMHYKYKMSNHLGKTECYFKIRNEFIKKNADRSLENTPFARFPFMNEYLKLSIKEEKINDYISEFTKNYNDFFKTNSAEINNLYPPSSYFTKVIKQIENTDLFKTLNTMPKGAILHIHSGSIGSIDWILKSGVYIHYAETKCYLNMEAINSSDLFKETNVLLFSSMSPAYNWSEVTKQLIEIHYEKIVQLMTMSPFISDLNNYQAWDYFNLLEIRMGALKDSSKSFEYEYLMNGLKNIIQNNIQYVEIRVNIIGAIENEMENIISSFKTCLVDIKKTYTHFDFKLIISDTRSSTLNAVIENLEGVFKLKKKHGDFILGYDLVGEEATGNPTIYYLDAFINKMPDFERKYGTSLNLYFHDGESNMVTDKNMFDAILLKCKRIGHGINSIFFPEVQDALIKNDICLEICPISNQIFRYVPDMRAHPGNALFHRGVPMVISSDDPLFFGITGLSYDYWEIIVSWNLNLLSIKRLIINSIIYSSLNEAGVLSNLKCFLIKWSKWIDDVYANGGLYH